MIRSFDAQTGHDWRDNRRRTLLQLGPLGSLKLYLVMPGVWAGGYQAARDPFLPTIISIVVLLFCAEPRSPGVHVQGLTTISLVRTQIGL